MCINTSSSRLEVELLKESVHSLEEKLAKKESTLVKLERDVVEVFDTI